MTAREVDVYRYRRPDGVEAFQRVRFEWPVRDRAGVVGHGKAIKYRHRCRMRLGEPCGWTTLRGVPSCDGEWHWGLPSYTDDTGRARVPTGVNALLYRLPAVFRAVKRGRPVYWAEGEKDAKALAAAEVCGTSHHQGAEVGATRAQAMWLRGAQKVVLLADWDAAGAYDVIRRHDLLVSVGVPAHRLSIVGAAGDGKDAYDHLVIDGRPVSAFEEVDKDEARAVALEYRPPGRPRRAYRPGRSW